MNTVIRRNPAARAFTLIELIAVIVVLAILAGVAIPKYIDYTANARASATKGTLGAVRSAIANFYANSAVNGSPAFPTLTQLQTTGTVMQEMLPANPYNSSNTIAAATWATTPPTSGTNGWNYDATAGKFWANSNTTGVNENAW
jgi:prepilin-type N-terminal cleavage/methylation domain-containing protein